MYRSKLQAGALALALLMVGGAAFAQVNTGAANFATYVAFGDSLTAGYSNGSINEKFQRNSYPALIYRQATGKTTGFEQPLVSAPGLPGALRLTGLFPTVITPTPGAGQPINLNLQGAYNNMAIPGASLHDLLTKTASTSASDPTDLVLRRQNATQLEEGLSRHPTFVSLWIGNNDALAAATSGIAVEGVTLTPAAQFDAEYRAVVNAITVTAGVKQMVVANIPDVTSIPFVTTIPRFLVNPRTNQLVRDPGGNPIPLIGPDGPLQAGDFVLLTASAELGAGRGIPVAFGGTGVPLSNNAVLSAAEAAAIKTHVDAYNTTIRTVANEKGAAFVDANAVLRNIATSGLRIGGISYSSAFLTGGIFGYDGVHPTPLGYAYVANLFIDAINATYGGDIPEVDLYPYVFGPLPSATAAISTGKASGDFTSYVFTPEARRSLLLSLNVPKWIVDGTKPPRRPRHPRG